VVLLRLTVILLLLALAVALVVDPGLFPGARNYRFPVIVGLILLAALNGVRLARAWQMQTRERRLQQIPKKPLGL
jgi:uncharacterized integral membrane protein